jgi:hypothetical protein
MARASQIAFLAGFGAACAFIAAAVGGVIGADPVQDLQLATRYTARASFLLFLAAFGASTLHRLARTSWSAWLLERRRGLGLAFAVAHLIHLGFIVSYLTVSKTPAPMVTVWLGGAGYVAVVLMAATSSDWAVRTLGPATWRRLHAIGGWYVWLVFLASYAKRSPTQPAFSAAVAALLLIAVAKVVLARSTTPRTAAA